MLKVLKGVTRDCAWLPSRVVRHREARLLGSNSQAAARATPGYYRGHVSARRQEKEKEKKRKALLERPPLGLSAERNGEN